MTKNVKLIYKLIQKDLKSQGWDDEAIAGAIAEAQRERQATGADDNTICVKEMSYLSQESLQIVTKQLNRKGIADYFGTIGGIISAGFKVLMPYMSLIAVVICLINLFYLANIQSDIKELRYSVDKIKTDYDNSDVINAIEDAEGNIISSVEDTEGNIISSVEDAEGNIISSVEDAESNIKRNLIIWNN